MRQVAIQGVRHLQASTLHHRFFSPLIHQGLRFSLATAKDSEPLRRFLQAEEALPLSAPTAEPQKEGSLAGPRQYGAVCTLRQKVIGAALVICYPMQSASWSGWWLFEMKVLPLFRRLGIGERIVDLVLDLARREGGEFVDLLVYQDNLAARRLYQKTQFYPASLPWLEAQLAEEAEKTGRRRLLLRHSFSSPPPSQ
jgi:ribosomal protein S18 acetylase RimI-like enzyme